MSLLTGKLLSWDRRGDKFGKLIQAGTREGKSSGRVSLIRASEFTRHRWTSDRES